MGAIKWAEEAGISKARLLELTYLTLQYEEKKKKANDSYFLRASYISGTSPGHSYSSPTERNALRCMREKEDVELIEKTLKRVCEEEPALYKPLLLGLTTKTPYEYLNACCGQCYYYSLQHRYYIELDKAEKKLRRKRINN